MKVKKSNETIVENMRDSHVFKFVSVIVSDSIRTLIYDKIELTQRSRLFLNINYLLLNKIKKSMYEN